MATNNSDNQEERFYRFVRRALLVGCIGLVAGVFVFFVGLGLPMSPGQTKVDPFGAIVIGFGVLSLLFSTTLLVGSMVMRAAAMNGYRPWQFSLKWLLVVMTVFAAVLGFTAFLVRLF